MGEYVHHCVFCGWSRPAEAAAMLSPSCESCGCTLQAQEPERFEPRGGRERRILPDPKSADITGTFAALAALPFVLPFVGVDMGAIVWGLPLVVLAYAAVLCSRAARRSPRDRAGWIALAAGTGMAAAGSAVGIASAIAGHDGHVAFHVGSAASPATLAGVVLLGRRRLAAVPLARVMDALLVAILIAALGVYFVAVPGFAHGDALLTSVALLDLLAVVVASLAAVARRGRRDRHVLLALVAACAAVLVGDAVASAHAAGQLGLGHGATALAWALAGYLFAFAAEGETGAADAAARSDEERRPVEIYVRVLVPLAVVLSLPALGFGLWIGGTLPAWGVAYFAAFSVLQLILAFWRQAHLLVENRRVASRERALREEAMRRNEELEALTGLATTMTQTLEEAPIIEQALEVLHLAARASSSALHMRADDGTMRLEAATGDWRTEKAWAGTPPPQPAPEPVTRGGRQLVRLALAARGHELGVVTLVRPAAARFDEPELKLLGLLVGEMAIAVQNARDYREKLEQAIRDPLTGLYNRRFLFEAAEKEVRRCERYGSEASLVLLDVDDFKSVNDTYGHASGDDVLRAIARICEGIVRPTDSLARIGGEEFALLLPETKQLDALLIAERVRTAISRTQILPDRRVRVSGGVASCPQDASTLDELHRRADAALYWAKRNGKDICAVASEVTERAEGNDREGLLAHLYALVAGIDAQQLYTRDHSENVAAYAVALGQELGLDRERIMRLRRAALLHDVGKVAIDRRILDKPGKLDDAEFAAMKLHPSVGATMLAHAGLEDEAHWVRHHHERVDGCGYPDAIAGEEIPLEARIIFVADSFEAMTSDRPYRSGMPVEDALAELERCAGTQFQPEIVVAFARLVRERGMAVLSLRRDELSPAVAVAPEADPEPERDPC